MTVRRPFTILASMALAVVAAACSEHLNGGAACPALCPGQNLQVLDTTIRIDHSSPVFDTTIGSYPLLGTEFTLLVANIPERVDVRGTMRFDSLVTTYPFKVADTTATLTFKTAHAPLLFFAVDTRSVAATRGSDRLQFLVYNIDTTADTTVSILSSMFNPSHLIGKSPVILASQLGDTTNNKLADTVRVPLDSTFFLAKLKGDRKLRVGIQVQVLNFRGDGARLTISDTIPPFVRYWAITDSLKKDTTVGHVTSSLRSTTPVTDSTLLGRLLRFPLIVQGALPDSADALNVGGIPARRVFLRFALPKRIIDTANVIRATLLLTPRPARQQLPSDTVAVYPWPVVSSNKVMTPAEATNFIVSNTIYNLDSVRVVPSGRNVVALDFVNAVRNWQNIADTVNTRALVLRILTEGGTPLETSFWSSFAPDTAKRPHVRIQYVKRSGFGVP